MKIASKLHRLLATSLVSVLITGCAADRSVLGHRSALSAQNRADLTPTGDIKDWRKEYMDGNTKEADRQFYRNEIIRRLMREDDEAFNIWAQKLYGSRAISSAVSDFATGLMGAISASSGASAARSLGLAITGVSGARSAADRDIFLEKSAGALISKMQEDRAKVDAQITQYLQESTADYPLEEGLRDFVRYYQAGTLANASETLQADAKVAQHGAQGLVEAMKGDTVIAPAQIAKAQATPDQPVQITKASITNAQLAALRKKAAEIKKQEQSMANLLADTTATVNQVREAIEAADSTKRIDYAPLMDPADSKKEFPRTQNGFFQFLKKNANNAAVLKSVRESAKAQMPSPPPVEPPTPKP